MKHGTLIAATLVSIFTCCQPLATQAGGKGFSLKLPGGGGGGGKSNNGGGGGSNWNRGNGGGGNWNRGGGNWGGGYNNYNYQTYPDANSYYQNQPYQYPTDNGATTQQYAAPVTQDYSTPAVQPNSVPTVQSNSLPAVTITTNKPQGMSSLQVVPMATAGPKPNSLGGTYLTGPSNGSNSSSGGNSASNGAYGGNGGGTAANGGGNGFGSKGPKWGKGGKGKSGFAIVGGQLMQVFSSDDGGSWVAADPDTAQLTAADDSQAPAPVDLAGQNPTAAITLLNPRETRSTVNFNLGSQTGSLQSGFAAQATASDPQLIVFDRGGAFGQAQYTLSPGAAYRFVASGQGWDLRSVTQ
jgi:hypothetical protein